MNASVSGSSRGILVCAATQRELEVCGIADARAIEPGNLWQSAQSAHVTYAVTGVGIPHTLLNLPPLLDRFRPARVVNLGIAGAYPVDDSSSGEELAVGAVVIGTSEVFADLGMEIPDGERFRPLGAFPFADASLQAPLPLWLPSWVSERIAGGQNIKTGRGATVNACTGTLATGGLRRSLFGADFESMEGAAVALACAARNIPVLEVRAISNVAARRDLRPENIQIALDALASFYAVNRDRIENT